MLFESLFFHSFRDNIDLAEMPFHPVSYFCQIPVQSKQFDNINNK